MPARYPPEPSRRARRAVVAVVVALAAAAPFAASAQAYSPAVTSETLRAHGLTAVWNGAPAEGFVPTNAQFGLRVQRSAKAARSARVRVTLTRTLPTEKRSTVVLRRTLRSGSVGHRVNDVEWTRYRVTVRIGKRVARSTFVVRPVPSLPGGGPGAAVPGCVAGAHITAPSTATIGDQVSAQLHNVGSRDLTYGMDSGWEQHGNVGWIPVDWPPFHAVPAIALLSRAGSIEPIFVRAWETMTPGTYRIALRVRPGCGSPLVAYSGPITVTAPES